MWCLDRHDWLLSWRAVSNWSWSTNEVTDLNSNVWDRKMTNYLAESSHNLSHFSPQLYDEVIPWLLALLKRVSGQGTSHTYQRVHLQRDEGKCETSHQQNVRHKTNSASANKSSKLTARYRTTFTSSTVFRGFWETACPEKVYNMDKQAWSKDRRALE